MVMIYDAAARCWRAVSPATVARWMAWRFVHPAWHAPLRTALEATIACGKAAALATALASGTLASGGQPQPEHVSQYARGGVQARSPSTPAKSQSDLRGPGGSRAVGGNSVGPAGLGPLINAQPPHDVPEPPTLALLGAAALLALLARRHRPGARG